MRQPEESSLSLVTLFSPKTGSNRLQVSDLVLAADERGVGLALVFVAFPALIPILPPGASMVAGILVVVIAGQMLIHRRRLWLPARVLSYRFSERTTRAIGVQAQRWEQRFTKLVKPRLRFMTGSIASTLVALPVLANGIVLFLPLPFLNTLPAIAIMTIGIGLAGRDGLLVLAGALTCAGIAVFVASSPALLRQALSYFQ